MQTQTHRHMHTHIHPHIHTTHPSMQSYLNAKLLLKGVAPTSLCECIISVTHPALLPILQVHMLKHNFHLQQFHKLPHFFTLQQFLSPHIFISLFVIPKSKPVHIPHAKQARESQMWNSSTSKQARESQMCQMWNSSTWSVTTSDPILCQAQIAYVCHLRLKLTKCLTVLTGATRDEISSEPLAFNTIRKLLVNTSLS